MGIGRELSMCLVGPARLGFLKAGRKKATASRILNVELDGEVTEGRWRP
jgi:hypothetical protein